VLDDFREEERIRVIDVDAELRIEILFENDLHVESVTVTDEMMAAVESVEEISVGAPAATPASPILRPG
jgi:hypothetical protein